MEQLSTWASALTYASNRRYNGLVGHLATITTQVEFDGLRKLLGSDPVWIGATNAGSLGVYTWVGTNDQGGIVDSDYWYSQPPFTSVYCVTTEAAKNGKLLTSPCTFTYHYVVEYERMF